MEEYSHFAFSYCNHRRQPDLKAIKIGNFGSVSPPRSIWKEAGCGSQCSCRVSTKPPLPGISFSHHFTWPLILQAPPPSPDSSGFREVPEPAASDSCPRRQPRSLSSFPTRSLLQPHRPEATCLAPEHLHASCALRLDVCS